MKENKKNKKSCVTTKGDTVYIEDLNEAVNKLDKKFGLRLKHPDETYFPENYRRLFINNSDINIIALILTVNGISLDEFFTVTNNTKSGKNAYLLNEKVTLSNKKFTDLSIIDWDTEEKYNTNSMIFRIRFITLVLVQIMGKTSKIMYNEVMSYIKNSPCTNEYGIVLTKQMMVNILKFINIMLTPGSVYENIILKMFEYTTVRKKRYNAASIRKNIILQVLNLRDGLVQDPLTGRFFTDDLGIYNVIKTAFMLCTGKKSLKKPTFEDLEGATVHHNLIKIIEELGRQIRKEFDEKNCTPMFKAFVEARPTIYSDFSRESLFNPDITLGITALSFTDFVCDNKYIHNFIGEMLKNGK